MTQKGGLYPDPLRGFVLILKDSSAGFRLSLFTAEKILPIKPNAEVLITGFGIGPDLFPGGHLSGHFTGDPVCADDGKGSRFSAVCQHSQSTGNGVLHVAPY